MINDPENQNPEETKEEEKPFAERVKESLEWVVNMMNNGNVNSKDVYPGGSNRYHGD